MMIPRVENESLDSWNGRGNDSVMLLTQRPCTLGEGPGCQFFSWDFSEFSSLAEVGSVLPI